MSATQQPDTCPCKGTCEASGCGAKKKWSGVWWDHCGSRTCVSPFLHPQRLRDVRLARERGAALGRISRSRRVASHMADARSSRCVAVICRAVPASPSELHRVLVCWCVVHVFLPTMLPSTVLDHVVAINKTHVRCITMNDTVYQVVRCHRVRPANFSLHCSC